MSEIIDFNQFKKKEVEPEPLFQNPTLITLGSKNKEGEHEDVNFHLLANLVYEREQYLALQESDGKSKEIILVKAIAEDGELVGVEAIAEGDYDIIRNVFEKAFELQEETSEKEKGELQ